MEEGTGTFHTSGSCVQIGLERITVDAGWRIVCVGGVMNLGGP